MLTFSLIWIGCWILSWIFFLLALKICGDDITPTEVRYICLGLMCSPLLLVLSWIFFMMIGITGICEGHMFRTTFSRIETFINKYILGGKW